MAASLSDSLFNLQDLTTQLTRVKIKCKMDTDIKLCRIVDISGTVRASRFYLENVIK